MASKQPQKSHQLTVRLEPQIHEALTEVGRRIGVKPAVLAGMAIGDYVTRSQATYGAANNMQEIVAKEMSAVMGAHFAEILTAEQLEKIAKFEE